MKYVLNIIIPSNNQISNLRKKYDPHFGKIKNHITLVYPFEYSDKNKLINHIENNSKIKPFKLSLKGFAKSKKGYYLYMLLKKGKTEVNLLYRRLNSGILSKFKNKDMPCYIPHLTLGNFKSSKEISSNLKSLKDNNLEISFLVKEFYLMKLIKNNNIRTIKKFWLK